ncbi:MAG: OmpA family protein [Gammaproteobacteria bacterium]|nr:OmpA family protein [Gammaproteobacteria bacterium]MBV9696580.1 OmpA family protein [Gammaproteobacteria bacterium]
MSARLHRGPLLLLLLGCAAAHAGALRLQPGAPQAPRSVPPAALRALQARLEAAPAAEDCEAGYAAHSAQAWLNFALYAQAEQLPSALQAAARGAAAEELRALESRAATPPDLELPGARHVRDDLWQGIAAARQDGRRCAAPKPFAYCAVQLAWAGYEASAGGWRHADPYVRIAEDYCATALATPPPAATSRALPAPAPTTSAADLPAPPPPPADPTAPPALTVHFAHDRWRVADIRSADRARLRQLAHTLRSWPQGARLRIAGHADITGTAAYNVALSERRARTVVRELRRLGVPQRRIAPEAHGSAEPLVSCPADALERRRYLECLEPNRRVTIELDLAVPR